MEWMLNMSDENIAKTSQEEVASHASSSDKQSADLAAKKSSEPAFFSLENFRSLATLALIIFAIRWSVASPYHVPTASMEPTSKLAIVFSRGNSPTV